MRRSRLYRIGAGLLAGLMVFTGVPQTVSFAEEPTYPDENAAYMEIQADDLSGEENLEDVDVQNDDPQTVAPREGETPVAVTGIQLTTHELTLTRTQTTQLEYKLDPANADTGTEVTFSSTEQDKVSVDSSTGFVTAVAATTTPVKITAETANGKKDSCMVTVEPIRVKTITITPQSLTGLKVNEEAELTVKVTGMIGDKEVVPDNAEITISSYDQTVAVVGAPDYDKSKGTCSVTLTAKGGGNAMIYAVSKDDTRVSGKCSVNVESAAVPIQNLKPKYANITMFQDNTRQLEVVYDPVNTSQTGIEWSVVGSHKWKKDDKGNTVNEESVTVDGNGVVKCRHPLPAGVNSEVVTVKATSTANSAIFAEFTITIKKPYIPASSLTVLTKELTLEDGGGEPGVVEVRVEPITTTDTEVTATIDNGTVAEFVTAGATGSTTAKAVIDSSGIARFTVKGKKPGSCDITFQAGTAPAIKKDSLSVTVNEYIAPVDSVELSETVLNITEQKEEELTAEIKPFEAENRYIDWNVSNPEIATIEKLSTTGGRTTAEKRDGKLTSTVTIKAHMIGECIITATAAGGKSKTCKVKVTQDTDNPATDLTIQTETNSGLGENPATIYIRQGQSVKLTPKVTPAKANQTVRWSSSTDVASVSVGDNSVCTVNADHTGECVVTAQASSTDPACKKEFRIVVKKPRLEVESPDDFSFEPDVLPVEEADLKQALTVKFYAYEKPALTDGYVELTADQYRLQIVAEDGTSLRPYTPEDLEKAGTKILVISYDYGKDGEKERIECPDHIPVTMKEFSKAELVSISPLGTEETDIWNVPNGTPLANLPLAKTTEITVRGIKSGKTMKMDADIEWNLSAASYNPNLETAQEFVVYGTVKLPGYISVSGNDISQDVSARVHVREKATAGKQVEAPTFSVLGGEKIGNTAVEVPYGSKIVIESNTEEAVIYYMQDRRPDAEREIPQDEEHRYKGPLEITALTTTIYAIAVKEGYTNSNCSECTVKLIQADSDIPDDPDDPEPDQVTDEDRPASGKVPNGLWVAIQPDEQGRKDDYPYTGSAIKPVIHVYDHTTLLIEKKDYTITYKNNIKAGEKGSAYAPSIIVKGKGNYSGQASVSFTIKPQSIEEDSVVMEEYAAVAYNKKEQKPNPVLVWKGKKLTKGKDFTVTDRVYKDPKVYDVTVTGIGNFTGTKKLTYEIFKGGVSASKLTVSKISDQKCTGEAITPSVVVKYKKTVLKEGANYTVQYRNNIDVGTASVIITGLGNYKGTKRVDFKIKAMAKISEAGFTMVFNPATPVYNGTPVKPVSYKAVYQEKDLKEGVDYKVSYANNDKAGTASLILTGMGRFNGTAKKNFKIQAGDLSKCNVELAASCPYVKGGCKPKPKVYSGNYVLQEGIDYTLSYSNHNAVGNSASVTVKGKGSFKGKTTKQFAITRQDIGNLQVVAADKVYKNKANSYRTSVKVIDVNGKALVAGKDYDKEMLYTYADGSKQGEQVLPTDLIPRGTNLRVEVRVTNPKNYVGAAYGVYRIVQADISKAKVKVDDQEYTGRKRKPGKDQIHVTLNGAPLGNSDYEIVGYENNVNQGTAKVTIKGSGNYGGTKTVSFKIRKKGLINLLL